VTHAADPVAHRAKATVFELAPHMSLQSLRRAIMEEDASVESIEFFDGAQENKVRVLSDQRKTVGM
jgi:hypothetical protein